MNEFVNWIYGRIELPEKSVLITVDDGAMGTGRHNGNHLATILNEYKMHATLFLIAGWWDIENYKDSPYLEIQSHTYDMHQKGPCGEGQLVCANYDQAKADIQNSLNIIGDNTSFCYPFYQYDDEAIQAIKDFLSNKDTATTQEIANYLNLKENANASSIHLATFCG